MTKPDGLAGLPAAPVFAYGATPTRPNQRGTGLTVTDGNVTVIWPLPDARAAVSLTNQYVPSRVSAVRVAPATGYAAFPPDASFFSTSGSPDAPLDTPYGTAGLTWLALLSLGASCAVDTWLWQYAWRHPATGARLLELRVVARTDGAIEVVRDVPGTGADAFVVPADAVPRGRWVLLACRQRPEDDRMELVVDGTVAAVSPGAVRLPDGPASKLHELRVFADARLEPAAGKLPVKLHAVALYDRVLRDADLRAIQPPAALLAD